MGLKRFFILICFILLSTQAYGNGEGEANYAVWIESNLNKLKQGTALPSSFPSASAEIKLAKNEYEAFQLVLYPGSGELKDVNICISDLKGKKGGFIRKENIELFVERYIYISEFTDSPGWYPDALVPLKPFNVKADKIQPIWVSIYISPTAAADEYEGTIALKPSNAKVTNIPFKVTVWNFCLPTTPNLRTSFSIQPGFVAKRHNILLSDPHLKVLMRKYNDNALRHRISPKNLVSPSVSRKGDEFIIDFEDFDTEMYRYFDEGLTAFQVSWSGFPQSSVKVSTDFLNEEEKIKKTKAVLKITEEHLREKGWLDLSYIYLVDEPRREYFPQVKQIFSVIKDASPGIKRLLTFEWWAWDGPKRPAYAELAGYVDIWAVNTRFYDEKFLKERQKKGEEVWWYVSNGNRHPYPTFGLIDYPAIDHRILFWQAWKYDINGFLYFAVNYWEKNVWENPESFLHCNGDGSLIYWNEDGPVNSIRWEVIRDGIEDYDYFCILRETSERLKNKDVDKKYTDLVSRAKKILDVSDLTPSLNEYTKDPQKLLNRREEIAELIVKIRDIIR